MIEAIGNLIRYIVTLIFLATLLEMILPHGQFRRYLRMLVGILLILTLLSPVQNIMRLAPRWDIPVFMAAPANKEELALILSRGDKRREDGLKEALANYRGRLYTLVESLLAREYDLELIELAIALDEDPASAEFGAIKKMMVTADDKGNIPSFPRDPVQGISIFITHDEQADRLQDSKGMAGENSLISEKEAAATKFLANYFLLAEEWVHVTIVH